MQWNNFVGIVLYDIGMVWMPWSCITHHQWWCCSQAKVLLVFQTTSGEQGPSSGVRGPPRQEEGGCGAVCHGGLQDPGPQEPTQTGKTR